MKGGFSATPAIKELVPADDHRGEVVLQHLSGDPVYLEFGKLNENLDQGVPVVEEGLVLSALFPLIKIKDHRARLAINGRCDTGDQASGTYTTDNLG